LLKNCLRGAAFRLRAKRFGAKPPPYINLGGLPPLEGEDTRNQSSFDWRRRFSRLEEGRTPGEFS
jgi:hypothetical protein